jgi:hypothetical protein
LLRQCKPDVGKCLKNKVEIQHKGKRPTLYVLFAFLKFSKCKAILMEKLQSLVPSIPRMKTLKDIFSTYPEFNDEDIMNPFILESKLYHYYIQNAVFYLGKLKRGSNIVQY